MSPENRLPQEGTLLFRLVQTTSSRFNAQTTVHDRFFGDLPYTLEHAGFDALRDTGMDPVEGFAILSMQSDIQTVISSAMANPPTSALSSFASMGIVVIETGRMFPEIEVEDARRKSLALGKSLRQ